MNKTTINNENEFVQQENLPSVKAQGGSSKKLYNQLYQSAQFDSMPSSMMNKSAIGMSTSQTQFSNKAFQERLNKSGIYFKNGTLVNITDIDIDGNQTNEKEEKIRDLEDRENLLKKQLREVSAKLEKDIAILNQKLEFAELELREAKQKIKDNDEFFRLFEINDLRYQQHPIFKQKFAQLNEMHNQQIATKQREIENLRALLRQYNEPTVQSSESLNSMVFSQKKQQRSINMMASSQKDGDINQIEEKGQEQNQTPTKNKEQLTEEQLMDGQQDFQEDHEKVKRTRNFKQSEEMNSIPIKEHQELQQQFKEEVASYKERIIQLENQINRFEEIITQNEKNKQIIQDLQQECKNLKEKMEESISQLKKSAEIQEKQYKEQIKARDEKIYQYELQVQSQQQLISQQDQQLQESTQKCINLERQQQDLLERTKSEHTAFLQEQLNSIIVERESAIQEYYEQEYLNKLEFYQKNHNEILEENQRNFEQQLQEKEDAVINQAQQREQIMFENMQMKQLQFDQKITSYELQLQTKQQELIAQQHTYTAIQQKFSEQEKQIESLTDNIEKYSNENDQIKQLYETQNDQFEKATIRNNELQKECEQQHQLILQLELEIQQATEKAKKLYVQQIQDLESANQTYQMQIKDLESKVTAMSSKLNAQNQSNMNIISDVSKGASETKKIKQKQKLQVGVITNLVSSKSGEVFDQQSDNGAEESVDEGNEGQNYIKNIQAEENENSIHDNSNITMFSATNISYNLGKVNSTTQQQTKLIQQLQSQLQQQQSLFVSDQNKIKQETTQLQQHIKQLEQLLLENRDAYYKERNVLESSIQKQKNDNKELQMQLQKEQQNPELFEVKNQLQDITQRYNQSEEQRKVLQSRLDKIIEQQAKQIESESSSNQILFQVKNNEINEYRIRIEVLQNQLKEQDSHIKKAQGTVSILELEKNELVQQVNFLENQQQQTQDQIVEQYEGELQSLSSQLHQQVEEFAQERQRFLDTIETLQQSISFQNTKNQELIQQCEQIEQEEGIYEQQQETIRNLEEKLQQQDTYIIERENFYAGEMQKKEKYVTDLVNQIHILEMNRKEMMDEVEQEQERFLAQIQNQRQSQSQSQNDQLTSKQIILALQQEREYLEKKIEILESQKESFKNELSEMTQKLKGQHNQDEKVKNASPNRNFGFVSFKAGSNCVSFAPQQLGGIISSSPGTQPNHRKGNSVHQLTTQGSNIPCSTSQSQILYQGGSSNNILINPQYDNGQYLNTSQFGGGSSSSNYMSNSSIVHSNQNQQYQTNSNNNQNNGVPSGNSMAQSSIFSCGQSFIQNNNHFIFGSVNHSSLYGLSQAQMLEIIERAYIDRLQQQQIYFEQKFRKEREDNSKRSREPALIADKKKLLLENEKLQKEIQQLRNQRQLEDEINSIRGHQHQILQDTAKLCLEKSRSKNRPTRDISANKEGSESDKFKNKFVSAEKFDLNLKKKRQEDTSHVNLNDISSSQIKSQDITNYFSPNKLFTEGDLKKNKQTVAQTIQSIQTGLSQIGQTQVSTKGHTEAGIIVGQRHSRGKNSITSQTNAPQIPSSLNNQNISPIQASLSSITSSQGSSNFSKQSPMQSSLLLSQTSNKGALQQNNTCSANNNYTKAYGAKESTLISINSNSDLFKSNIFNSNNTSSSFLKNSNIGENLLKNVPSHNLSTQTNNKVNQVNSQNTILSAFPHRDSTPTTILKKSYINFDDVSQSSQYASQQTSLNISQSNNPSHVSSRMQRSITEQRIFNPQKLTSQKY